MGVTDKREETVSSRFPHSSTQGGGGDLVEKYTEAPKMCLCHSHRICLDMSSPAHQRPCPFSTNMGMKVCLWFSVPAWIIKALAEREKTQEWGGFSPGKLSLGKGSQTW